MCTYNSLSNFSSNSLLWVSEVGNANKILTYLTHTYLTWEGWFSKSLNNITHKKPRLHWIPRVAPKSTVRSVNISFDRHPTSEEELLSFPELRNYESSNSSRKTASEFIDECVIPAVPGGIINKSFNIFKWITSESEHKVAHRRAARQWDVPLRGSNNILVSQSLLLQKCFVVTAHCGS